MINNNENKNESMKCLINLLINNNKFVQSLSYKKQRSWFLKNIQKPKTVIICCSDSRVPPEIVFQKLSLGELFIVRSAGHVLDDASLESILFAIDELNCKCIVVLGHQSCGAVTYAYNRYHNHNRNIDDDKYNGKYNFLYHVIRPSLNYDNNIDESIKNHTIHTCSYLIKKLQVLSDKNIKNMIYPCFYNSGTGHVDLI